MVVFIQHKYDTGSPPVLRALCWGRRFCDSQHLCVCLIARKTIWEVMNAISWHFQHMLLMVIIRFQEGLWSFRSSKPRCFDHKATYPCVTAAIILTLMGVCALQVCFKCEKATFSGLQILQCVIFIHSIFNWYQNTKKHVFVWVCSTVCLCQL